MWFWNSLSDSGSQRLLPMPNCFFGSLVFHTAVFLSLTLSEAK
jgi:hypothetical protein